MDFWLGADTQDVVRSAYRAGYVAGNTIATRVDVMRWELQFYYSDFCRSEIPRDAIAANYAKQGFIDGFAAAQNRKAFSAHVLMRSPAASPLDDQVR